MKCRWTFADFRGLEKVSWVRRTIGHKWTVRREHSQTLCRGHSRTLSADIRGLPSRTFVDYSPRKFADIRGLPPRTSVDRRGLLPRAFADFYRRPSRTFTADFRRRLFVVGSQRTVLCRLDTTTIQPLFQSTLCITLTYSEGSFWS